MPIYEYQCQSCDHEFEALQKMSDDKLTDCPQCQRPELTKLISASSFQLKGSGWYESDFKNSKSPVSEAKKNSGSKRATTKSSGCSTAGCGCS